jgi:DNA-directed RNA polymerase specialized sigma24 family protein
MPQPDKPARAGTGEPALPGVDELDTLPDVFGSDLAHLFDYCRGLLGQDDEAAHTARSVLDSAHARQQEPERLRTLLLSLGRRQALALCPPSGSEPSYMPLALIEAPSQQTDNGVLRAFRALTDSDREILDLVYRHDIRAANLSDVLGIPTEEAYRRLALAEGEFVSLVAELSGGDVDPAENADGKLEDIAALPLAALPARTDDPATLEQHGERRSHRSPAQLVAAAVLSGVAIAVVVFVAAAGHPAGSRAATLPGTGTSNAGTPSSAHAGRSAQAKHRSEPGQPVFLWGPVAAPTATSSPSSPVITRITVTAKPAPCPAGIKANFRWHYTANGSAGGWSGTATQACPGSVTMGPQAMDGNLRATPGTTLQAGYDLTVPGNSKSLTMTVSAAHVTFAVSCVSGSAPSAPTISVALQAQTYQITSAQWYPSGDQSSPLVYQGSVAVPALCGPGGEISLARGGTFTATLG